MEMDDAGVDCSSTAISHGLEVQRVGGRVGGRLEDPCEVYRIEGGLIRVSRRLQHRWPAGGRRGVRAASYNASRRLVDVLT